MAMFIRVKRKKTTYFVQCDPTETILETKQKLQSLTDYSVGDQRLILLPTEQVLEDAKTLAEQKVENDAAVALTLRQGRLQVEGPGTTRRTVADTKGMQDNGEFENINIEKPDDHHGMVETDVSSL